MDYRELWPTFLGSKFFPQRYLALLCQSATKSGNVGSLTNLNLFLEFRERWFGGPVTPCGDMHQSFTGDLDPMYYMLPWNHPVYNPNMVSWAHLNPNGISIGSAAFAGLTTVTDRQTTPLGR